MAWREQTGDIVAARINEDQAWARIQQKTFTRWCNTYLSERMLAINDLATDLEDGVLFINLLEEISGKEVARKYNKKPRIRAQKLENLKFCFDFLKAERIKLVSVGPEDLADGNLKLILGIIWTLILRFQITQGDGSGSAKNALLEWVRSKIPEYNIKNFTRDWQDGKAICALANAVEPGVLDLGRMNNDALHNATMGMDAATTKMEIPKVLDPEDMVSESPDEHANMTYISYFRDYLERCKSREAELAILRTPVPGKCLAYGPGLEGGECGIPTEFTIEAINAKGTRVPIGGHDFRVILKDSKGNRVDTAMQDNDDGTYIVTYTPTVAGVESVAISLFDKHIKGSVFNVYISPATVDASQCEAYGPGLENAEVGVPAPFTVVLKNRNGMQLSEGGRSVDVRVVDGHGCLLPVQQKDNEDGTYSMSYQPNDVGRHEITVSHKDQAIGKTPFVVDVQLPEGAADHTQCYAEGPGLEAGNSTALPTHFTVHVLDKHGQHLKQSGHPIDVQLEGPDGFAYGSDLKDNGDGTLTCTYHAKEPGTYRVDVLLRSARPLFYHHVKGSTYTVQVEAGTDAGQSFAYGPGLESGILDTLPTYFTIQAADRDGKKMDKGGDPFEVTITDPTGKEVPAELKDNGDGTYRVDYKPNGPGRQLVHVAIRGAPIKDAPFKVDIKAGASAGHCLVEKFTFVVQTKTATGEDKLEGGEDFKCSIAGPQGEVEGVNVRDLGNGKYKVSYKLPEAAGEYLVNVTINGDHIKGSPWRQFV